MGPPVSSESSQCQDTRGETSSYPVFEDDVSSLRNRYTAPTLPASQARTTYTASESHTTDNLTSGSAGSPHMLNTNDENRPDASNQPVQGSGGQIQYSQSSGSAEPVFPFSRPYSLPEAHANSYSGIPPHMLAQSNSNSSVGTPGPSSPSKNWIDRSSSASLPLPMQTPYFTLPQVDSTLQEGQEWKTYHGPNTSSSTGASTKLQDHQADLVGPIPPPRTPQRPEADQPPSVPSSSAPTSPASTEVPRAADYTGAPPVTFYSTPQIRSPPTTNIARPMSSGTSSSSSSYPEPDPPTILPPPPPPAASGQPQANGGRRQAPYEPFLSHAPPPADSWIAIETTSLEYRLVVRLPGYRRDGM